MKIDSASELCRDASLDHPRTEGTDGTRRVFPYVCGMLFFIAAPAGGLSAELPPVRIAYFVPSDREPIREYRERLDRVMTEVQRFYRDGMTAAGFGPKTFALERDGQDRLMIHAVQGTRPMSAYGRNASAAVRREVQAALAKQEIDMDRNTWLIFQVLLRWDGNKAAEIGPYVGGGSHLAGTALVYDDGRLDATLLASQAAGGYYGRPCSIGEFNSHYIGPQRLRHAVSWTCQVAQDGRFRLEIGEWRPGPSQLRLWVCHPNGIWS